MPFCGKQLGYVKIDHDLQDMGNNPMGLGVQHFVQFCGKQLKESKKRAQEERLKKSRGWGKLNGIRMASPEIRHLNGPFSQCLFAAPFLLFLLPTSPLPFSTDKVDSLLQGRLEPVLKEEKVHEKEKRGNGDSVATPKSAFFEM